MTVETELFRRLSMATCDACPPRDLRTQLSTTTSRRLQITTFSLLRLLYSRYELFITILVLPGIVQRSFGRLHKQDRDEIT